MLCGAVNANLIYIHGSYQLWLLIEPFVGLRMCGLGGIWARGHVDWKGEWDDIRTW